MVAPGMFSQMFYFFRSKASGHLGRASQDETAFRISLPWRNKSPGSDQAVVWDDSSVEDDCPHANKNIIAYLAAMKNGPMTDSYIIANDGRPIIIYMDYTVVLNVGILSDNYISNVSPDDGVIPDTGPFFQDNPPNENSIISHKGFRMNSRLKRITVMAHSAPHH
jgi:hypothetical protein